MCAASAAADSQLENQHVTGSVWEFEHLQSTCLECLCYSEVVLCMHQQQTMLELLLSVSQPPDVIMGSGSLGSIEQDNIHTACIAIGRPSARDELVSFYLDADGACARQIAKHFMFCLPTCVLLL